MILGTPRMRLRCWEQADRHAFAAMHADPEVMHDYGGPLGRSESDAKLDRYTAMYRQHGFCRWAIENREGARAEALAREHARLARRNLNAALQTPGFSSVPGAPLIKFPEAV